MTRVEIVGTQDGKPFPSLFKRIVRQPLVVRLRFNLSESTPNKVAKVIGIAGFGGLVSYRRCIKGDLGDIWNVERENSDRIVAIWKRDHVQLRVYPYIRGSGATTDGTSHSQNLIRVDRDPSDPDWTHEVVVQIRPGEVMAQARLGALAKVGVGYDTPARSRWQWLMWSHARNGGEYLMQNEKLVYEYELLP